MNVQKNVQPKQRKLHFSHFINGWFPCPPASEVKKYPFPTDTVFFSSLSGKYSETKCSGSLWVMSTVKQKLNRVKLRLDMWWGHTTQTPAHTFQFFCHPNRVCPEHLLKLNNKSSSFGSHFEFINIWPPIFEYSPIWPTLILQVLFLGKECIPNKTKQNPNQNKTKKLSKIIQRKLREKIQN